MSWAAPWGRYNYAFIAEISFCFSDAILVSRTDDERKRGGGGESCPPGRGKRWVACSVTRLQRNQWNQHPIHAIVRLDAADTQCDTGTYFLDFKDSVVNVSKMYCWEQGWRLQLTTVCNSEQCWISNNLHRNLSTLAAQRDGHSERDCSPAMMPLFVTNDLVN